MPLAHPKSFVAGILLLASATNSIFAGSHGYAAGLRYYNHWFVVIACPLFSVVCLWHGFLGKGPLFKEGELYTSVFLGIGVLIMAAGSTFATIHYHRRAGDFLVAAMFFGAAAYYLHCALQERRVRAVQTAN